MMPSIYYQTVAELQQKLNHFKQAVAHASQFDHRFTSKWQQIYQLFQQQVQLSTEAVSPAAVNRAQSIQTEINKQLRLLKTDLAFFQAAKQASTIAQRQQQIGDRCDLLLTYCTALLDLPPKPDEGNFTVE